MLLEHGSEYWRKSKGGESMQISHRKTGAKFRTQSPKKSVTTVLPRLYGAALRHESSLALFFFALTCESRLGIWGLYGGSKLSSRRFKISSSLGKSSQIHWRETFAVECHSSIKFTVNFKPFKQCTDHKQCSNNTWKDLRVLSHIFFILCVEQLVLVLYWKVEMSQCRHIMNPTWV